MNITRREALRGTAAATAAMAMPAAMAHATAADPLREGVQALVREIRENLSGDVITAAYGSLQEVADRLESLPGIVPIPCEWWDADRRAQWWAAKNNPT